MPSNSVAHSTMVIVSVLMYNEGTCVSACLPYLSRYAYFSKQKSQDRHGHVTTQTEQVLYGCFASTNGRVRALLMHRRNCLESARSHEDTDAR